MWVGCIRIPIERNWIPLKAKSINRHLRKWERKKLGAGVWGQPASQEQVHKSKWLIFCHSMSDSLTTMCHGPYKSSFAVTAAKTEVEKSRVIEDLLVAGTLWTSSGRITLYSPRLNRIRLVKPETRGVRRQPLFLWIVCSPWFSNMILKIMAALAQSAVLTTNRCQDGHIDLLMKKITGLVPGAVVCKCTVQISALSHTHLRIWRWK